MDTPTKRCTKCSKEKSATLEFFGWYKARNTWNSQCRECEYTKRQIWNNAHPDKVIASKHRYCIENPEKRHKSNQRWQHANLDKARVKSNRWRQANPDKARVSSRRWREEHPDKQRASKQHWNKKHPEQCRKHTQQRRARKQSLPATFTEQDWQHALEYFNGCCVYCGHTPSLFDVNTVLHQEHHIAQSKGGGYTPDNILPACQSCNLSKHDKDPEIWIIERFGKKCGKTVLERVYKYFEWVKHH